MNKPSICCVVPSIRETQMAEFRKAWAPLFEKHGVTLITVWDGETPKITVNDRSNGEKQVNDPVKWSMGDHVTLFKNHDLICRRTDAVRNLGFIFVADTCHGNADYILTLDDDVHPPAGSDPIQEHLDVLQRRVPISWMNTALPSGKPDSIPKTRDEIDNVPLYLRGFPYGIRDEAPVKVSHGVWVNVPDFDGKTQLELGKCDACSSLRSEMNLNPTENMKCLKCNGTGYDGSRLPYSLPYFRGPIPKGTYFPFCGMNVMVHRDALPYLYFAPMGPDSGVVTDCTHCGFPTHNSWQTYAEDCCPDGIKHNRSGLNRFADIWCGILLKRQMDAMGWAIYTGASTVIHTRASDPFKNVEQEKLGIEWNESIWKLKYGTDLDSDDPALCKYVSSWYDKAARFRDLIRNLQGAS